MIGYTLDAISPSGFKASRSGWSEGSLWLLKPAIAASHYKTPGMAVTDAIEGKFEKMRELRFDEVAVSGMDYRLMVSIINGSFFTYDFESDKETDIIRFELARKIANLKEKIRDQVALAMFETIIEFQAYYVSKELWKEEHNFLHIQIDL
jgi:hypothetical protein